LSVNTYSLRWLENSEKKEENKIKNSTIVKNFRSYSIHLFINVSSRVVLVVI